MRPQKIAFGEMRSSGVRGVLVYCSDYRCSHSIAIPADGWPDDVRLSDIEPRFVCKACGKRGADVRPHFAPRSHGHRLSRKARQGVVDRVDVLLRRRFQGLHPETLRGMDAVVPQKIAPVLAHTFQRDAILQPNITASNNLDCLTLKCPSQSTNNALHLTVLMPAIKSRRQ